MRVAHFAQPDGTLSKTAVLLAPRLGGLTWMAALVLAAGFFVPDPRLSYGVAIIGAAIAGVVLVVRMVAHAAGKSGGGDLKTLITHDARPVFVTDASGAVVHRNGAARKKFGDAGSDVLEKVLSSVVANAPAVVFRLQAKATRQNAAREDVVTRSARYLMTVHRVGKDQFFWSIEEVADRAAPTRAVDKISLPMMTVGNSGTILFMNDAMRRLAGGRIKSLDKLFTDVPKTSGEIATITTEDGPVDTRVIIIEATGGRAEYFLAPADKTELAAPAATMEAMEEFPVALLKIAQDGQIVDANHLARDMMELEKAPNKRLSDLVEGLGRPISEWLSDASEGRSLHKPEVLRATGREDELYLQVTLGRILEHGEVFLMAMISDATELKTLEAQFVQSQKMQAIGQLAGGVAHDFNNLLTAISGHCDLLMLRHDPSDPDFGDLEQINQNANRAASLVGQLLAFSRKQNLQLEVVDMRDTLADLTHLLNRLVGAQIALSLTHDPQLMSVRADRRQLEQVIMNLVVNARDAMDGGGEISIETRNMKLQSDLVRDRAVVPRGEYVLVKVTDNGAGIPKEKCSKIFEPFFTTKGTGEGTGLGLSTVYGIIKQSGGFIFVDSEVGKGSTFTIFFPTYDKPEVTVPAIVNVVEPRPNAPAGGMILLVEDEAPVRAFASRALKLRGFQVLEAENAEEALSILEDGELTIDVIVTDVVMPGLDGPSWVKIAQESRPDIRVVFVSGYAEDNFAEDQAAIPNSVFLPKPFSLDELTNVVRGQMNEAA